jgi:type II secretory pathway pseudopilin PulG
MKTNKNSRDLPRTTFTTKSGAGFTLIEVTIYVAIIGTIATSLIAFAVTLSNARGKTYAAQEVQNNGRFAMRLISERIRRAAGINGISSVFGSDPGALSLAMESGAEDPTRIDLNQDDGRLQITEGIDPPLFATSDEVRVTNLIFTNLTGTGNRGNIRIEITIEYKNTGGDVDYTFSQDLQTSVSLRQ